MLLIASSARLIVAGALPESDALKALT